MSVDNYLSINRPLRRIYPLEANTFYACTLDEFNAFSREIATATFTDHIQLLLKNATEGINFIKIFPFGIEKFWSGSTPYIIDGGSTNIIIADIELDCTAHLISPTSGGSIIINGGTVTVPRYFHNYNGLDFLDYSPYTTHQLYIPYIGFVDIDANEFAGAILDIKYGIDLSSGILTAYILRNNIMVNSYSQNISIDLPIGGGSFNEISKKWLSSAISFVGAASSFFSFSSAAGAASRASNVVTDNNITFRNFNNRTGGKFARSSSGNSSIMSETFASSDASTSSKSATISSSGIGNMSHWLASSLSGDVPTTHTFGSTNWNNWLAPQRPFLVTKRPRAYLPADYNHYVGRPLRETKKLSELRGLTVVANVHMDNFPNATDEEISEIEQLLYSGVILSE